MSPDKLKHALASAFQIVAERSSDEEIHIMCPVPGCGDKTGNRSINVKTLYTNCWRCSGKQPRHVRSLFHLLGLEFDDDHVLEPHELQELIRGKTVKAVTPVQDIPLPEGFLSLSKNQKSCYWRFCKRMAESKNLGIEDLEAVNAGFTRDGEWEPFCIFPVTEGPRTVYYQGRTYDDEGVDKTKKFPSKKEVPYGSSYWVYNLDALSAPTARMAVIVESILNVLSLKRRLREIDLHTEIIPVCIFTHFLSLSQLTKMGRYRHIKDWCLLFDSDSTDMAQKTAMSVSGYLPASVASMPHGKNKDGSLRETNDANDDVDSALLAIDARRKPAPFHTAACPVAPSDRAWLHG